VLTNENENYAQKFSTGTNVLNVCLRISNLNYNHSADVAKFLLRNEEFRPYLVQNDILVLIYSTSLLFLTVGSNFIKIFFVSREKLHIEGF